MRRVMLLAFLGLALSTTALANSFNYTTGTFLQGSFEPMASDVFGTAFRITVSLKRMVARDGVEPPTPAFSGLVPKAQPAENIGALLIVCTNITTTF